MTCPGQSPRQHIQIAPSLHQIQLRIHATGLRRNGWHAHHVLVGALQMASMTWHGRPRPLTRFNRSVDATHCFQSSAARAPDFKFAGIARIAVWASTREPSARCTILACASVHTGVRKARVAKETCASHIHQHITSHSARRAHSSRRRHPPPILSLLSLSLRVLFLSLFPLPTFSLVLDTCHNEKVQIHILAV